MLCLGFLRQVSVGSRRVVFRPPLCLDRQLRAPAPISFLLGNAYITRRDHFRATFQRRIIIQQRAQSACRAYERLICAFAT
ncbi:TPA: hypothetical protein MHW10_20165 [Klebsiella pneumoniae]|nr:hypothetical protein BMD95_01730 [Klebsiella pneumoniae]OYM38546.1 hypothetical protein CI754_14680 [Klebsiella quasipneumoniae subsp. similipneumoniae]PLD69799.1 hypothetical protein B6I60_26575 [Klebsiella pneumoniae]HBX3123315.1 hypothetical protein [Klebsiella pneumoniae]HBX3144613.1 hypothetical protein [Klebsiella pneumoniae]